ncbi:MAG: hypothetical protein JW854_14495, partial [Actinobacteria bacterium]|nr:hypothetical protein [Actinomycetota bacterium]
SLGLKSDGTIVAWGWNDFGQCDVPAPNSGFVAVAAGFRHSLGLKSDGTIVAWGWNDFGQRDVPAPNSGFVAVAAGNEHSLGLKSDGTIVAWGRNYEGQCDVPAPNSGFVAVAGGGAHSLAIRTIDYGRAWGSGDYGECDIPAPNSSFIAVAAGSFHGLGLKAGGTVKAWGLNNNGQCDVPAPNAGFTAVTAGSVHSLGLKADGRVVAWGWNGDGQCDVPMPNSGFVAVAGGSGHSLGLKSDGTIVAWGDNYYGQCDVPAPNSGFVAVAGGYDHSLGLKSDGTVVAWGDNTYGQCDAPALNFGFTAVGGGGFHNLGLRCDGTVAAWGRNNAGQCDVPAPNSGFVAVAAGAWISLGLADGFAPPLLTSVDPDHTVQGQTLDDVSINGSDFRDVAITIRLVRGVDSIEGTDVTWVSGSQVTCDLAIPAGAVAASDWDVCVKHEDDGKEGVLADSFSVATPTVYAAVSGVGGQVDPASQSVSYGGTVVIDITPDAGYKIASITDNGAPAAIADPYVITGVTVDHNVEVAFEAETFSVDATILGGNGNLSPLHQTVGWDGTASIAITPDPGYHIASLTDNGVSLSMFTNPYVIENVREDHDVIVTFALDIFTVTASAPGGNGTVVPLVQFQAFHSTASIAITPDPGYHIESITDNGVPVPIADPYLIQHVYEDHAVVVTFALDTFDVNAAVYGGHGTVDPATQTVDWDGTASIAITPDPGYHIASITDNWVPQPVSDPYVIENVQSDHTVIVTFTAGTFTVDASVSGGNGSVDPASQAVDYGGTASVHIYPDSGYHIESITDNGVLVPISSPYTIDNVQAEHDVVVAFAQDVSTWYLAEGATAGGMETWVLVANPNPDPVTINVSFLTDDGFFAPTALQGFELGGESRVSFDAGAYMETYDLSTLVSSARGEVVCERACYGNSRAWAHDSIGVTAPSDTWYLAEGCTEGGMETFVLLLNPGSSEASVDISFQTDAGEVAPLDLQGVTIPAFTRRTLRLNDYVTAWDVSTMVTSSGDVVCERAMYGSGRTWAHDSIGATAPADTWYLAEGCTDGGMETWILVQNPNAGEVSVDLTFMTSTGPQDGPQDFVIPAGSRVSFNACSCVTDYNVSTLVTSEGGGIICERAMYGGIRTWAHDSIGVTAPADIWYLAEGCTDGGMETWILVQNPNPSEVTVDLTFMTSTGAQEGPQDFVVPAGSRVSFNACSCVIDYNVSTKVEASDNVICEKAMYGGGRIWAHDSVGYAP